MADYATKEDLKNISNSLELKVDQVVNKAVEDLSEIISDLAQSMHSELREIKSDIRIIKEDIIDLQKSHDRLLNTLDTFLKRLDDIEIDNTARDAQLARLERWIEQIAVKTNVKLQY